jgi:hypothetical protein
MRLAVRDYLIRVGRVKGINQSGGGGENAVAGST